MQRGPTLDGLGKYYRETIEESDAEPVDVVAVLKETKADVLVSYLPVGSEEADKFYAQCAIDAGVGFVNALPVFIASDPEWAKKFEDAGVPIVGDDIKSQVGATITHRVMAKLFEDRGVVLDRTYQLNVGGNMDFKNMLERERLESKKVSKTQAVTSNLNGDLRARSRPQRPHRPVGLRRLARRPQVGLRPPRGSRLRRRPLNLEYKLEVWDSPNSAGIIIDAVRAAKIAMDRGIGGPILSASTYLMKSPAGADARRPRPRRAGEFHQHRGGAGVTLDHDGACRWRGGTSTPPAPFSPKTLVPRSRSSRGRRPRAGRPIRGGAPRHPTPRDPCPSRTRRVAAWRAPPLAARPTARGQPRTQSVDLVTCEEAAHHGLRPAVAAAVAGTSPSRAAGQEVAQAAFGRSPRRPPPLATDRPSATQRSRRPRRPSRPPSPAASQVEKSFVSSVGWVKPGDATPSRIIVTNPARLLRARRADRRLPGRVTHGARAALRHRVRGGQRVTWTIRAPCATGTEPGQRHPGARARGRHHYRESPRWCGATSPRPRQLDRRTATRHRGQPRPEGDPAGRRVRHRPVRRPAVPGRAGRLPRPQAYQARTRRRARA